MVSAEFLVALKPTLPFPVPEAPDEILSHEALLTAVHAQLPPAMTVTVPEALLLPPMLIVVGVTT